VGLVIEAPFPLVTDRNYARTPVNKQGEAPQSGKGDRLTLTDTHSWDN